MLAYDAAPGSAERHTPGFDRLALTEELLDAALGALRQGTLDLLVGQHPRAARWLMRRSMPIVAGTAGDRLAIVGDAHSAVAAMLLRWLVTQLRPDLEPRLDGIGEDAWLNRVAWRPALAVMCHHRMLPVPAFPARYRRRVDEAAVDNLCGLWDVGPSTFYRYVERGKHQMAQIASEPLSIARRLSLRGFVLAELLARQPWADETQRLQWHREQAAATQRPGDCASLLWHALQAHDPGLAVRLLKAHASELAGAAETDALVERIALQPMEAPARFHLLLGQAALCRTRNSPDRELTCLERALQLAAERQDPGLLGMVYGALGRYHESRDVDRAFACYDDSARYLLAADPAHGDAEARAHYMTTLVRSAWLHVLRSHPKAKAMLEQADRLSRAHTVPEELVGLLEQSWGEYWRIAGDTQRALLAKHRALNVFERLGDRRSVLVTYLNLITLHGEAKEPARAQDYARRIFEAARASVIEPSILVSTHHNLGVCYGLSGRYAEAATEFREALELSRAANLRLHANRARFNLANAYYRQFLESHDPELERLGDSSLDELLRAPDSESLPSLREEAKSLKQEVLGAQPDKLVDRLLDEESATHLAESLRIQRQRAALAAAGSPAEVVQARLDIADAYLAISIKEREAAQALIDRHGLAGRFAPELARMREAFDRGVSHQQRALANSKDKAADLLDDGRRIALIEHLLREGAINKSGYAEMCGVSPATASKHLATLTERGLLQQTGKGPSTRYLLAG